MGLLYLLPAYVSSSYYCLLSGPEWLSRYSDSLHAERSGVRIPVRARFSAPVQTGPPSLLYNGWQVSFPRIKRLGRGVDHPPSSSAEIKERV
jgi:hypothetical protein